MLLYLNLRFMARLFRASLSYLTPSHAPVSLDLLLSSQAPLPQPFLPFSAGDPQGAVFSSPLCTITTLPKHSHPPHACDSAPIALSL